MSQSFSTIYMYDKATHLWTINLPQQNVKNALLPSYNANVTNGEPVYYKMIFSTDRNGVLWHAYGYFFVK